MNRRLLAGIAAGWFLGVMAVTTPVLAFELWRVTIPPQPPFEGITVLEPTAGSPFTHWDLRRFAGGSVPYSVHVSGTPDITGNDEVGAVSDSFDAWEAVEPAEIAFQYAGTTPTDAVARDWTNSVFWDEVEGDDIWDGVLGGSYGMVNTWTDQATQRTLEVDTVLSGYSFIWTNGPRDGDLAELKAEHPGGCTFQAGDKLIIYVDGVATKEVTFAAGAATVDDIVNRINSSEASRIVEAANQGPDATDRYVVIKSRAGVSIQVTGTAATYDRTGFSRKGVSTGKKVIGNKEPIALFDGATLIVSIDGGAPQTVTFVASDFPDIANATAAQVVATLSAQLAGEETSVNASLDGSRPVLGSATATRAPCIEIVGGTGAAALGFSPGKHGKLGDVQSTLTHEFGHFIGLAHTSYATTNTPLDQRPTMMSGSSWARPFETTLDQRTLAPDDIQGTNFLYTYDVGDAPLPYPTEIRGAPSGEKLNGVDVLAAGPGAAHFFGYGEFDYEWLGNVSNVDDGVKVTGKLNPVGTTTLTVEVSMTVADKTYRTVTHSGNRYLNAWFDWDRNKAWEEGKTPEEHVIGKPAGTYVTAAGIKEIFTITVDLPASVYERQDVWARFRFDFLEDSGELVAIDDVARPKGAAQFGEVEDYEMFSSADWTFTNDTPTVESALPGGTPADWFVTGGPCSCTGTGYPASTSYPCYIVRNTTWTDGMQIPPPVYPVDTVLTDVNGSLVPNTLTALTAGCYDMVIDVNRNGIYDAGIDALDDNDIAGGSGLVANSTGDSGGGTPNWAKPTVISVDFEGTPYDVFAYSENVYFSGSGYLKEMWYHAYALVDRDWADGDAIPTATAPSHQQFFADDTGAVTQALIHFWPPPGDYDIIIDLNGNERYDADIDPIDGQSPGYIVRVGFRRTVAAWSSWWAIGGILATGAVWLTRWRKR